MAAGREITLFEHGFVRLDGAMASDLSVEEVREFVGADSLAYLELKDLVEATGSDSQEFCRACFDGHYPVPIPEREPTKLLLEQPVSGQ